MLGYYDYAIYMSFLTYSRIKLRNIAFMSYVLLMLDDENVDYIKGRSTLLKNGYV
jgi:hypothetical protein